MAAVHPSDERTPLQPSLKLATSSSEPSPLQRTPTSDYLVLSRVDSYNQDIQLPRPQHWYILTLFGVLDAAYTISAAATFGVQGKNEILMVVLGLCRALVVMLSTSHRRVREVGWMIVGLALISALAALAELNLIIQRKAFTSTIPATLALYCFSHVFFGLLHWVAFAAIVGISRDRNPYGLGLQSVRRRPGPWRENMANIQVRRASMLRDELQDDNLAGHANENEGDEEWENRLRKKRNALEELFLSDEELDGITEEEELEDEFSEDEDDVPIDATMLDYDEDEEEEEIADHEYAGSPPRVNNIIDIIPSPSTATGTRHRTISTSRSLRSRRSFYARASQGNSPEDGLGRDQLTAEPSPITPTTGYGTFRSLAGI